jgi:hypothetical protein
VSLASLKSFHEMVVAGEENTDKQDQARYFYIPPLTDKFTEDLFFFLRQVSSYPTVAFLFYPLTTTYKT